MQSVLGAFIVFMVFVSAVVIAFALAVRSLRRRNRVAPDIESPAPISWLTSPAKGPRLHRRLRDATAAARASVDGNGLLDGLGALVVELERHAASVDRQLVLAIETLPERFSLDVWHHVIQEAVRLAGIVKSKDVRMIESRGNLDLAKKAIGAE